MNVLKLLIIIAAMSMFACTVADEGVTNVSQPDISSVNIHYLGNRPPLQPLSFIKLPVGAVQPEGWVREFLYRQRDGLTGHLTEISHFLEKENNAWLSETGNGDHGWEEVPYWLKGYISIAYLLNDPAMIKESEIWIEGSLKSQRPDGYFGPWIEKRGCPDLWGNMIMLWCLQTYYEHTQDKRVIDLMTNYFKWQLDFPEERFLKDYWENCRGGDNLHSVFWLYNIIGEQWLLTLAEKIHRCTSNWGQDTNFPNWHVVNISQGFREPATYWALSKNPKDLTATYNNFWLIRRIFGQVPGGMYGSDENCRLGYVDPRQGTETCAFVEQMASDELLLRYTGDPFWADHCEDVAFNSYPAATMPDFKTLRYFTSPNMSISNEKNHSPGIQNRGAMLLMNAFDHRCCQHNHAQGWPYYAEHLWMATPDNGLAALLFSASSVKAKVGDGTEVTLTEETNYPFEEQITIRVNTPKDVNFPLYIRIPVWCENAGIKVNNKSAGNNFKAGSYTRINRDWKDGDVVTIDFPMKLSVRQWVTNQNSVSVNYGPLTFSLKIKEQQIRKEMPKILSPNSTWEVKVNPADWPSWNLEPGSPWNYALMCSVEKPENSFTVVKKEWPSNNFPFTAEDTPVEIKAKGKQIPEWVIDEYDLTAVLPPYPVKTTEPVEDITLIPMGAARLRISAFPHIE